MAETQANPAAYPPLDVLKPVADGVWIVDSGPLTVMGQPLPLRMTVIRLGNGGLWLHSPTRFDARLKREMETHGPIRHLVAPNSGHWVFLDEWQRACPEATLWAAPGLRERGQVQRSGLRIDQDLSDFSPEAWTDEIEQVIVTGGFGFKEVDFFHRPTRTMILTDLVVNLEADKLPPFMRAQARLIGTLAPDGRAPVYLRLIIRMRRREAASAARRLVGFAPERVIFAHGRWFERNGTAELRRSLRWLLP